MSIALLNLCLFLLLIAFFFYGLSKWDQLLGHLDEEGADTSKKDDPKLARNSDYEAEPAGRFWALWVLIVGSGLLSFTADLLAWILNV